MTAWRSLVAAAVCSAALAAQAPNEEWSSLQELVRKAVARVAPAVVAVETFGGARAGPSVPSPEPGDGPGGGEPQPANPDASPPKPPTPDDPKPPTPPPKLGPLRPRGFQQAQGTSTGLVLSSDGWIAVSSFALAFDPTTIVVTLADGRSFGARRAGQDFGRGLALLKVDAQGLPVPEFAPTDKARVGQWVLALGRTFGREQPSVHLGIVSATDRIFGRALQTDAATSPANYGGPLVDLHGCVLGVCVPLSRGGRDAGVELYDSGIGFAVPIAGNEALLDTLRRGVDVHRGWLGISTAADELSGARVTAVAPGSPAAALGLSLGDRIIAIDGAVVRHAFQLQNALSAHAGGDRVELVVQRADELWRLEAELANAPREERTAKKPAEEAGTLPWEEQEPDRRGR